MQDPGPDELHHLLTLINSVMSYIYAFCLVVEAWCMLRSPFYDISFSKRHSFLEV